MLATLYVVKDTEIMLAMMTTLYRFSHIHMLQLYNNNYDRYNIETGNYVDFIIFRLIWRLILIGS